MYFSFKFRIPTDVLITYMQILFSEFFELKIHFIKRSLTFLYCYRAQFLLANKSDSLEYRF
jgi:hypothetical protein